MIESKTAAGEVGSFEFDALGRRTKAYYDDGYAAYFAYDGIGNMIRAQEAAEDTVYFAHDALDRTTQQQFAVGGAAYYTYDAVSSRLQLTYPSGGTAYYEHDAAGRMTSVKAPSGYSATYEYDASGNRTKSVWGNGTYAYYSYDTAGRTERIRHLGSGGTALAYFDYEHDARGDGLHIARLDGLTTYYDYDDVGRLTYENWKNAGGSTLYGFTYEYDLAGNRTAGSILGVATYWDYNDADALSSRWTVPAGGGAADAAYYSYDLDGNLTVIKEEPGSPLTYFEYGSHGLMTGIKPLGGTEATFAYDALLRRIRMSEGAAHTYFRHDGMNLFEIASSDGTVTKLTHGYSDIGGIGSVVEVEADGTRYYLHQDHRGTLYKITDANGNAVWTGLCDAWGRPLSETGSNPTILWYQGQAWRKLTTGRRTYYVSPTRVYDVEDARFLERDPLRRRRGDSLYAYTMSAGLRDVDPTGLFLGFSICEDKCLAQDKVQKCRVVDIAVSTPLANLNACDIGRSLVRRLKILAMVQTLGAGAVASAQGATQLATAIADAMVCAAMPGAAEPPLGKLEEILADTWMRGREYSVQVKVSWERCEMETCLVFCDRLDWQEKGRWRLCMTFPPAPLFGQGAVSRLDPPTRSVWIKSLAACIRATGRLLCR